MEKLRDQYFFRVNEILKTTQPQVVSKYLGKKRNNSVLNENFSNLRIARKPSHQSLLSKRKQSAFSEAFNKPEKPEKNEVVLNHDLNVDESVHSFGKSTVTLNMDIS